MGSPGQFECIPNRMCIGMCAYGDRPCIPNVIDFSEGHVYMLLLSLLLLFTRVSNLVYFM